MQIQIPFCFAFVDYKVINSVETTALLNELSKSGTTPEYVNLLEDLISGYISVVKLFDDHYRKNIGRGVRQSDIISLKLFNAVLESLFRDLDWNEVISIEGEHDIFEHP